MGSLESPTRASENGSTIPATFTGDQKPSAGNGATLMAYDHSGMIPESDAMKRRRASILPLEVGTRVMCRWRDGKYHPVKVIERRRMMCGGPNDYEYYVHYTECKISLSLLSLLCFQFGLLGLGLGF
jgi:histone acetyltransferase MYST1